MSKRTLLQRWTWGIFYVLLSCFIAARFEKLFPFLGGKVGYEITGLITDYIGSFGLWAIILFMSLFALVLHLKVTPEKIIAKFQPYFIKEKEVEGPLTTFEEESEAFKAIDEDRNESPHLLQ